MNIKKYMKLPYFVAVGIGLFLATTVYGSKLIGLGYDAVKKVKDA